MDAAEGITTGQRIDEVVVEIDYDIIEHFSQHLYSSPNKAIEELVSNGFDAFATSTYVYIPGSFTDDTVLVWDDGSSMDVADLKKLWWIAQSPKEQIPGRIAVSPDGSNTRAMIGKFGIGKLASYAVGNRIAHLCRRGDRFLLVRVNFPEVPHLEEGNNPQKYETPIFELSEGEARSFAQSLFREDATPDVFSAIWDHEHWTLAIIDHLKHATKLTEGRLRWVVGSGMPLRPDFRVWVNDVEANPRLGRGDGTPWNMKTQEVRDRLTSEWATAVDKDLVEGRLEFVDPNETENSELGKATTVFPVLGRVQADVMLFSTSRRPSESKDEPRSYGYFIMVRGRLVNPNDELLFLSPPSYGTFYRCQFVIHADGLDTVLLADRERLRRDTPEAQELAILQRALYLAARDEIERRDENAARQERPESLLPVDSRPFFRQPLAALLLNRELPLDSAYDTASTRVDRVAHATDDPLVLLDDAGALHVNSAHPLFGSIRKRLGTSTAARKALQIIDAIAILDLLLEGHMLDLGIPDDQIREIIHWRDGLLREVATKFDTAPLEEVVREVYEESYRGGKSFEKALIKLFRRMGFEASHDGASGQWDGLVVAPIGMEHYRFTVEAKGSRSKVLNDAAEVSAAAAHREAANAEFALIIAREFVGFAQDDADPAVLKECRSTGRVSISTIKVLEELHQAIRTYSYPLDLVAPLLAEIESPAAKLARVRGLQHPTQQFDYRSVLEAIWQLQRQEAEGDLVSYRTVWQRGQNKWGVAFDDFERRLLALGTLAGPSLLRVATSPEKVATLLQHPQIVAERVQLAVELNETTDVQGIND